jgi:hypothetical protein
MRGASGVWRLLAEARHDYLSAELPAHRRMMPADRVPDLPMRYTGFMKPVYLDPLFKAELPVTLSHRTTTLAGGALQL